MSDFQSYSALVDRWQILPYEVLVYISEGLQPYTKNGLVPPCPKKYNHAYIKMSERLDKAEKAKLLYGKIQGIVTGVAKYLERAEQHAEDHYNGIVAAVKQGGNALHNNEGIKIAVNEDYFHSYREIFSAMGDIRGCLDSIDVDSTIFNFLKESGIDFGASDQPTRFDLFSSSSKEISKTHLGQIRGMKFIYNNVDALRVEAIKELEAIRDIFENTDWDSWGNFEVPDNDNLLDELTDAMSVMIFRLEDIQNIEKDLKLIINEKAQSAMEGEQVGLINDLSISKSEDIGWNDVTVTFISDFEFHIQYKGNGVTRSYKYAGFEDKRTGSAINAWDILLEASQRDHCLPFTFESRKKVEKSAQTLRKKFRVLFPGIKGDPVPLDKENHMYRFSFNLENTCQ